MRDCPTCHQPYESSALHCPDCEEREVAAERLRQARIRDKIAVSVPGLQLPVRAGNPLKP